MSKKKPTGKGHNYLNKKEIKITPREVKTIRYAIWGWIIKERLQKKKRRKETTVMETLVEER